LADRVSGTLESCLFSSGTRPRLASVIRLRSRALAVIIALLLGTLGVAASPERAYACDCATISTSRAVRNADAVFRGTVTDLREVGRGRDARIDIRFAVDAVYKGLVYRDQVVASPLHEAACGISPDLNTTWIIFANDSIEGEGDEAVARLVTTLCSGNLPTGSAPSVLGLPREPLPGSSDREERATGTDRWLTRGLAIAGIAALFVTAVAVTGLAVLWRPGRRL
jgi:hypothetical protein